VNEAVGAFTSDQYSLGKKSLSVSREFGFLSNSLVEQ
jgi:hypothetical protein